MTILSQWRIDAYEFLSDPSLRTGRVETSGEVCLSSGVYLAE